MRITGVLPSNRRGELIGQEVVLCSEKQMPRLYRKLNGRKRTGRLRGYHNHLRRHQVVSIPDAIMSVPLAMAALFRAMLSHDPFTAHRQRVARASA